MVRKTKAKNQPAERAWYTATLTPQGTLNAKGVLVDAKGRQVGRPVKVVQAGSKEEVGAILKAQGHEWQSITIVKGRDPGLTRTGGVDRYAAELQSMMGRLHVNAAAPPTPSPIWVHGDPTHDADATARTMWSKFMDESSHGLSVSDFPRFVICDVKGYPTLPLPSEAVKDEKRWDGITADVRQQLDFWKATLQERIERLVTVKRRSAEDTDQLKWAKAALKALEAFDGWDYQRYVEQILPGRKPHALDLDNRRLYRLSNGQLIPVIDLGPDLLRVDFWKRLLQSWDGPPDKRAGNVRAFLDHHHRKGGKPEQFRDLVKDTLPRLRKLTGRELLVDKVEEWLQVVVQIPAELMPTPSELALLGDMRWVLVKCLRKPTAAWLLPELGVKEDSIGMEDVKTVIAFPEGYAFEPAASEQAQTKLEHVDKENPGLKLTPLDGSPSDPLDVRHPYRVLANGKMFAGTKWNSGKGDFIARLKHEGNSLNTRADNVDALLNHHVVHGPNPRSFVEFVRGEVLRWKSDHMKSRPVDEITRRGFRQGWLVGSYVEPWLIDRCERWLEYVDKTGLEANTTATPQPVLTVPVIARLCWCMEKAGRSDHGIVNATAASRLAKHYGQLHDRAGEKLKYERDRFDGADGKPYLRGGPQRRDAYGRRVWAAVKVELDRLGYTDAVAHAEAILSDM